MSAFTPDTIDEAKFTTPRISGHLAMPVRFLSGSTFVTIGVGFGFVFAQRVSLSVFGRTITFQYLLIPVIAIISVLVTTAGCILPVRKAVEIDPALVLKGE